MLQALGIEDYGVQNVVGSIVAMSSLLIGTMSGAISRYLTYNLGKGDKQVLKTTFSTSVNAQIAVAFFISIVLEIAGVWFLNSGANIPQGRMVAANWVLQMSILGLAISLITSPYTAAIIAHEKMTAYAYFSIIDVVFKLAICFVIVEYDGDRLILLSTLQVVVVLVIAMCYGVYCYRKFDETHYSYKIFDKGLLKEITVYSGWNLLNNGASVFSTQGVNMLVNVFFGVTYNASRSIASTVNGAAQGFVQNFTTAFMPQVIKSYAAGDIGYSVKLVNNSIRFTWLMMYVFIVPICMEAEMLLYLWLGQVPPMAALFLRFAMFESLASASGHNLMRLIQADGRMKRYSIQTGLFVGLIFPISWLAYYCGAPVWSAYAIYIFMFFSLNIIRFINLKRLMPFSVREHLKESIAPCLLVSVTSFIVPIIVYVNMDAGIARFLVVVMTSIMWTLICSLYFGLTKSERSVFFDKAKYFSLSLIARHQK